jgi:molecular chaperone HtpG
LVLWREFGRAIKEGVASDFENKDKLLPLLLFQSSADLEKLTTLKDKDYVGRIKSDQEQIFYVTGESRSVLENSPHLEAIRDREYEVLYLVDAVDELLLGYVTEFAGKKLKSAAKGGIGLGSSKKKEEAEKKIQEQPEDFKPLIEYLHKKLEEQVKEVRLSLRMTTSPACLVVEEHDQSPMLERMLNRGGTGGTRQKRILELNPRHTLISPCTSDTHRPPPTRW